MHTCGTIHPLGWITSSRVFPLERGPFPVRDERKPRFFAARPPAPKIPEARLKLQLSQAIEMEMHVVKDVGGITQTSVRLVRTYLSLSFRHS